MLVEELRSHHSTQTNKEQPLWQMHCSHHFPSTLPRDFDA